MMPEQGQGGALVEARDVRFAYGEGGPAVVRGASLAVERGRLSALVGDSARRFAELIHPEAFEKK